MSLKLSDLMRDERTITVPVAGESLRVTYRPSGITPETEDRLEELAGRQRAGASLITVLSECLVSWDLVDDDGQPVPITPAAMRKLPLSFLGLLVRGITADMRPNPTSGGTSAATS